MRIKHPRRAATAVLIVLATLGAVTPGAAEAAPPTPPPPGTGVSSGSAGYLHPTDPVRVLDTRTDVGSSGPVGPGETIDVQVGGRNGIPVDAGAVVLNITVTEPTARGYVTAFPAGADRPGTANVNFTAGRTVPNLVVVKLGEDGKVSLFNSHGDTHLVADAMGWYDDIFASFPSLPSGGARQQAIEPTRLVDTRQSGDPIGRQGELELKVTGVAGIPADATAVALNVTVTQPTAAGHLRVYPTGSERPNAANLNFVPGQTVPNMVIAKVGTGGRVTIFNSHGSSHVVVDVNAYFEPVDQPLAGGELNTGVPQRLLDTRSGLGAPERKVGAGQSISVEVTGEAGVPDLNVDSVVLNVTVTEPTSNGYITVHPDGVPRPTAANLNFTPGLTRPNLVVAKIGDNGRIKLFNSHGSSHLVADVMGWYNGDSFVPSPPDTPYRPTEGVGTESDVTAVAATALEPDFAAHQAEFWAEHDPSDIIELAEPEALLERDATVETSDRLVEFGNDVGVKYPIWSQGYTYPNYDKKIGRLLFWVPSENRWSNCTATMVARNLAVTAAHCVVDENGRFTNLAFFAGLQGNVANGGIYTNVVDTIVPSIGAKPAYLTEEYGYSTDYAFVQFGATGGRYPGDIVGWYGMRANSPLGWLLSFGYPSEGRFFGRYCSTPKSQLNAFCYMYSTWGRYGGYQGYAAGWYEIGWGSDMTGGSSGGPVFAVVNGKYVIVSVNSNGRSEYCEQKDPTTGRCWVRGPVLNMWGPYFNSTMLDIYRAFAA